jgi:hypothetical protein
VLKTVKIFCEKEEEEEVESEKRLGQEKKVKK